MAMDVLAPGIGEIIGGSRPEERLEVLDRSFGRSKVETRNNSRPFVSEAVMIGVLTQKKPFNGRGLFTPFTH